MPIWSGLGYNYGHAVAQINPYPTEKVASELRVIRELSSIIRIDIVGFKFPSTYQHCLQMCRDAKEMGFTVVWGITGNGSNSITSANLEQYKTNAVLYAQACAEFVDIFEVGNELESQHDGSLTDTDIRDAVRLMAGTVGAVFPGKTAYSVSNSVMHQGHWRADGNIGSLDYICLNNYGINDFDLVGFEYNLHAFIDKFGLNKVNVTEFHMTPSYVPIVHDYYTQNYQIRERLRILEESGIEFGLFYQWDDVNDELSVYMQNGEYRPWADILFSKRADIPVRIGSIERQPSIERAPTPNRGIL